MTIISFSSFGTLLKSEIDNNSRLPRGDYKLSCDQCKVERKGKKCTLSCACQNENQSKSATNYSYKCNNDYVPHNGLIGFRGFINHKGKLLPNFFPQGNYRDSCQCKLTPDAHNFVCTLDCACNTKDSRFEKPIQKQLKYFCFSAHALRLSNKNGILTNE